MMTRKNVNFEKMDALSAQKKPFFFLVDFLVEQVHVYEEDELKNAAILIDFPAFKNFPSRDITPIPLDLKAYPESISDYKDGFDIVQHHLQKGNSYLANYTRKTKIACNHSLEELFYLAKAKYKVKFNDDFIFFSPETFIEIIGDKIATHPMKGTIDAAIENAPEVLKKDPKEKAEHYTVVDLLRNDLSMVANRVQLDEFQRLDYLQTHQKNLYAMSSEISGTLKPEFQNKIGSIIEKLLPAGSILGAPKKKTLEIVCEAERFHRGFYTGIAGWFDGENLDTCVMIRFIEKENEQLYFKSGGGITHLSKVEDEYEEFINKIYVPVH